MKATNLVKNRPRVLFYDTLGHDYTDGVVVYSLAELKKFWKKVYRNSFRIIFRGLDHDADFPQVCKLVAACGDMSFTVEELDLFFSGGKPCSEFNDLIFRGRHYGVELIGVTQRPRGFGRGITAMAKEFFIFSTREPDDLKYFSDRLGSEVVESIQTLPQYHYLEYLDYGNAEGKFEVKKDEL